MRLDGRYKDFARPFVARATALAVERLNWAAAVVALSFVRANATHPFALSIVPLAAGIASMGFGTAGETFTPASHFLEIALGKRPTPTLHIGRFMNSRYARAVTATVALASGPASEPVVRRTSDRLKRKLHPK
jgi:hypothetical protein